MIQENQVNNFSNPLPQVSLNFQLEETQVQSQSNEITQTCETGKKNQTAQRKKNISYSEQKTNNSNSTQEKNDDNTHGKYIQIKKNEVFEKDGDIKQEEIKKNKNNRKKSVSQGQQSQQVSLQIKEFNSNQNSSQGIINQGKILAGGGDQTPRSLKSGFGKQSDSNLRINHENMKSEVQENNSKQKICSYSFIPQDDCQERIIQIKGGIMIDQKFIIDQTYEDYIPHQNFSQYIECNLYEKIQISAEENGQGGIEVIEIPIKKKEGEKQFDNLIQSFKNESFQSQELANYLEQYQEFIKNNNSNSQDSTIRQEPFTNHNSSEICQNLNSSQNQSYPQINQNSNSQIINKDLSLSNQTPTKKQSQQQILQSTKVEAWQDQSKNKIENNKNTPSLQISSQFQQQPNQTTQSNIKGIDSSNEKQQLYRKQINQILLNHKSQYFSYVIVFKRSTDFLSTQEQLQTVTCQTSIEDKSQLLLQDDIVEMRIGHNSNFLTLLSQDQEELACKMIREKKFCVFNTKLDRQKYLSYIKFRIQNEMITPNNISNSFPLTCLASLDQIFHSTTVKEEKQNNQSLLSENYFNKQNSSIDDNNIIMTENCLNTSVSNITVQQQLQQNIQSIQQTLQQQNKINQDKNSTNKNEQDQQIKQQNIGNNIFKKCPFSNDFSSQGVFTNLVSNIGANSNIIIKSYKQIEIITLDDLIFPVDINVIIEECPNFQITIFKYDISDANIKSLEQNRGNQLLQQSISLNSNGNITPFQRRPSKRSSIKHNVSDAVKSRDKNISISFIDEKMRNKQLNSNTPSSSLKNIPLANSFSSDILNLKNMQYESQSQVFIQKFYATQNLKLTKTISDSGFGGNKTSAEGNSTTKSTKRRRSFSKEYNQVGTFSSEVQQQQQNQLQTQSEQNNVQIDEEYLEQQFQINNPNFYNCNQQEPINFNTQNQYQQNQFIQNNSSSYFQLPKDFTEQQQIFMNSQDQFQNGNLITNDQKMQTNTQCQQIANQQVLTCQQTSSILKIQIQKSQEIQDNKKQKTENQENISSQIIKLNTQGIQNEQPITHSEEKPLKIIKKNSQKRKQKKEADEGEVEEGQKLNKTKKIKKQEKEEGDEKLNKAEKKQKKGQKEGKKQDDDQQSKENGQLKELESKTDINQSNKNIVTENQVIPVNQDKIPIKNVSKHEGEPTITKSNFNDNLNQNSQNQSQNTNNKDENLFISNIQLQNQNVLQQHYQPGVPTSQSLYWQQYQSMYDHQNQNYIQQQQNYHQSNGMIYPQQPHSQHDIQQMNYNMYHSHLQANYHQNSQQFQMNGNQQQQQQQNQYVNNLQYYPQNYNQSPYLAFSPQIDNSPYQLAQKPNSQSPSPHLTNQYTPIPASAFAPLDLNTQNNHLQNQINNTDQKQSQIQHVQSQQIQQPALFQVPQQKPQQNNGDTTIPQYQVSEKQQQEEIIQQLDNQKDKSHEKDDDNKPDKKKQRKKRQSKTKQQNDSASQNNQEKDDDENKKITKNKEEENKISDENLDNKNASGEIKKTKQREQTKKTKSKEEQQKSETPVENLPQNQQQQQQQQYQNQLTQNYESVNQPQIDQLSQHNQQDSYNQINQYDYNKYQYQNQLNLNYPNNQQQNYDHTEKDYYAYGYYSAQNMQMNQDELYKQQYQQQYQISNYQPEINNNYYYPQTEQQQLDKQLIKDSQLMQQSQQKAESLVKTPKNSKQGKENKTKQKASNVDKSNKEKQSETQ